MPPTLRDQLLTQADHALQRLDGKGALEALDKLENQGDNDGVAQILRGVAHRRLKQPDEALGAFSRAVELEPGSAKARFSLAEQLFDMGRPAEALAEVERLLTEHPHDFEATRLRRRCERVIAAAEDGLPIRPLIGLNPNWTFVGYGVLLLSIVVMISFLVHVPLELTTVKGGQAPMPRPDTFSKIQLGCYAASAVISFLWSVLDILDRRGRFLWALPIGIFGFCGFFPLFLGLYMAVGRRQV